MPQYIEANTVLSSGDCYVIGFLPNHAQSLAYTVPTPSLLNITANQKTAIIPCSALIMNGSMLGAPSCAYQRIILIFIYNMQIIVVIICAIFYSQKYFTLPSLFCFKRIYYIYYEFSYDSYLYSSGGTIEYIGIFNIAHSIYFRLMFCIDRCINYNV